MPKFPRSEICSRCRGAGFYYQVRYPRLYSRRWSQVLGDVLLTVALPGTDYRRDYDGWRRAHLRCRRCQGTGWLGTACQPQQCPDCQGEGSTWFAPKNVKSQRYKFFKGPILCEQCGGAGCVVAMASSRAAQIYPLLVRAAEEQDWDL